VADGALERSARVGQGYRPVGVSAEEVAKVVSETSVWRSRSLWGVPEVGANARRDMHDPGFGVEELVPGAQRVVESGDRLSQGEVDDVRAVDAPPDECHRDERRVEVRDTLAEPGVGR
jgi:hypothetical protein